MFGSVVCLLPCVCCLLCLGGWWLGAVRNYKTRHAACMELCIASGLPPTAIVQCHVIRELLSGGHYMTQQQQQNQQQQQQQDSCSSHIMTAALSMCSHCSAALLPGGQGGGNVLSSCCGWCPAFLWRSGVASARKGFTSLVSYRLCWLYV